MKTLDTETAKAEYNKAKNKPESLCLITAQIVDGIIRQFKFGSQDIVNFSFESGETKVISVKGEDLLQENWGDVQSSIQTIFNNTRGSMVKSA